MRLVMPQQAKIQRQNPEALYDPTLYAYSHLTRIALKDIEEIIHISGQGGECVSGYMPNDFNEQCHFVFCNIEHALHAAGLDWFNIAHMHILVVDHDRQKHQSIIQYMQQYFPHHQFPACTLIPVQYLALPNMLLEIDATAYRFTT